MFARSAALRTGIRAAAPGLARASRRWESSSPTSSSKRSTTKPAEDHSLGSKAKAAPTAMIAGAFGLFIVGTYTLMLGNPAKAQEVADKVSSDAASKEHKFRRPTPTS